MAKIGKPTFCSNLTTMNNFVSQIIVILNIAGNYAEDYGEEDVADIVYAAENLALSLKTNFDILIKQAERADKQIEKIRQKYADMAAAIEQRSRESKKKGGEAA